MRCIVFRTRLGWVTAEETEGGISKVNLPSRRKPSGKSDPTMRLSALASDIAAYFEGGASDFSKYPIDVACATPFRQSVWAAAANVPRGKTTTYGMIAKAIGCPNGARAVGGALNANPLPVLIPCHRVVAANGRGGFAGGPLLKAKMLKLER